MTNPDDVTAGDSGQAASEVSALRDQVGELKGAVASLSKALHFGLCLGVLLLAALNVYLFTQLRVLRHQAGDLTRQATELSNAVQEYETNSVPWMDRFSTELKKYAGTHPNFGAMMSKYSKSAAPGSQAAQGAQAAQPAVAPAPLKH